MKNVFCFLSCCLLIFTSCSSDDSKSDGSILLLKKANVISNGVMIYNAKYIYQGGKLVKRENTYDDSSFYEINFIYTNDLVTKVESHKDGVLQSTDYFQYNSESKLTSHLTLSNISNYGRRVTDNYNPDGTCTVTVSEGDLMNQNTVIKNLKVFFDNGKVLKTERYQMIDGNMETLTTQYAYDDKKNPVYYMPGYNKLDDYAYGFQSSPNNITSITYSATNSSIIDVDESQYTYNSHDFPVKQTEIDPSDNGGPPTYVNYFY